MKRLILMGGRPWLAEDEGKKFVNALFRYTPKEVRLAFCLFASPESEWNNIRAGNTKMFDKFKGERSMDYQALTAENFLAVSAWANVIYITGGDPGVLQAKLAACGDVAELWDDKVIAGSSAGADLFCEGYIYLQNKTYGHGLGWVRASFIPHWRSDNWEDYASADWDFIEQKSLQEAPHLPVLCVPESEFVEMTVK